MSYTKHKTPEAPPELHLVKHAEGGFRFELGVYNYIEIYSIYNLNWSSQKMESFGGGFNLRSTTVWPENI